MAITLARDSAGVIHQYDGTLTGFSGDTTQWTSITKHRFVAYPLPDVLFGPTPASDDAVGTRQGQIYVEDGVWWLLYDAADGTNPWHQHLASSDDRGKTWTKLSTFNEGLNKVGSGTWAANATGWMEKRGSYYYRFRVLSINLITDGSAPGGADSPYYMDCWRSGAMGTTGWSGAPNVPAGNQRYELSGVGSSQHLPGSSWKTVDNRYINFVETAAIGDSYYAISISQGGSNPDGPFVPAASTHVAGQSTTGFDGHQPENARVFYSATLGKYVLLCNLIHPTDPITDANGIGYSDDVEDWSSAVWERTQGIGPIDTDGHIVGVQTHLTGPDGALIEGPNGEVPCIFDTDPGPTPGAPRWIQGHRIHGMVLEPATACFHIAQSANTTAYKILESRSNTDAVYEYAIKLYGSHVSGLGVSLIYRSDSTASNCYRATLTGSAAFILEKVVSGSATTIATGSGSFTVNAYNQMYRIKVSVIGNVHTLTFEGEEQVSHTDSSSPITTGTHLGLRAHGLDMDVIGLTSRASDAVTVSGLPEGTVVNLRSLGDLYVDEATADADGLATFSQGHWPHHAIEVDGTDYTVGTDERIWGGDALAFSGLVVSLPPRFSSVFAGVVR